MSAPPASEVLVDPKAEIAWSTVSRLVRRVHMFTGLFLAPWMLMYALSTLVMTHREYVLSFYPSKSPAMATERELDYTRSFPAAATREQIGEQILHDLGLDGTHYLSGGSDGKPLVINRQQALASRRITFDAPTRKLLIQREEFRASTRLTYSIKDQKLKAERQPMRLSQAVVRMHFRGGYGQPTFWNKFWGLLVDIACIGIIVWVASGLIMWWRLPRLRAWGAVAVGGGIVSFLLLVWTL